MEAELLLDNFPQIVSRAEDIPRLNEAILQLAVQGKLVPQDPNDEPAAELIKRIKAEKKRLIKEKKIKKAKSLPEIEVNEEPFGIPSNWKWVKFGNLFFDMQGGSQPPKREFIDEPSEGYIRLLQIRDFGTKPVPTYVPKNKVSKFCQKDDILIGRYGASVGKILTGKEGAYNVALVKVIFDRNLLYHLYIYYLLQTSVFQDILLSIGRSAQSGFNKNDVFPIALPLPPLAEQKRIVARIDTLLNQTRQLESEMEKAAASLTSVHNAAAQELLNATGPADFQAAWSFLKDNFDALYDETYPEAALANIAQLKQTILQLAVQGKLTRQDPDDEPASVLLQRIAAEKERLITNGLIVSRTSEKYELHPIKDEEIQHNLPNGWCWARMGEIVHAYRGYNPPKYQFIEEPREGYVRFIQITDFKTDEKAVYVPVSHRNKMVFKGEIIMAAYRHIGKLSREMEGAFNVALCKVLEFQPMNRDFIEKIIGTSYIRGELLKASERAHIPSMHLNHFLSLIVPLPPLNEQIRIVNRINILHQLCDDLANQIRDSQSTHTALRDTVLQNV